LINLKTSAAGVAFLPTEIKICTAGQQAAKSRFCGRKSTAGAGRRAGSAGLRKKID